MVIAARDAGRSVPQLGWLAGCGRRPGRLLPALDDCRPWLVQQRDQADCVPRQRYPLGDDNGCPFNKF